MPVTIEFLRCHVTVSTGSHGPILHHGEEPKKPSMDFHLPVSEAVSEATDPVPSATATRGKGPASQKAAIDPTKMDPNKIADRVYELMKQEIRKDLARGGPLESHARR